MYEQWKEDQMAYYYYISHVTVLKLVL